MTEGAFRVVQDALGKPEKQPSNLLFKIFVVLYAQLLLILAASFVMQNGPVFVVRFFFGLDFYDFHRAALDWLKGVDPYQGRLFTPPFSMCIGLLLSWLPFKIARLVFFVLNITLVFVSLRSFSDQVGLSKSNRAALIAIATVFYPFYFLVERGNIDGIVLALFVLGFRARSSILRAVMLGLSLATKVYSILLVAVLLRKRQWKFSAGAILVSLLVQMPFLRLIPIFLRAVSQRAGMFRIDENVSPSSIFYVLTAPVIPRYWSIAFFIAWAATLAAKLLRDHDPDILTKWPFYVPWLISFPLIVYPYSAILTLPLVALLAAGSQNRKSSRAESTIAIGFCLLGFQAVAWTGYVSMFTRFAVLLHLVPALGTLLMMIGSVGLRSHEGARSYTHSPEVEQSVTKEMSARDALILLWNRIPNTHAADD